MNARQPSRLRDYLDEEAHQIEYFRECFRADRTCLVPHDEGVARILETVLDREGWADCSGKGAMPPDFVNQDKKVMLEAMRVNDRERTGDRGKLVNPHKMHEADFLRDHDALLRQVVGDKDVKLFVNGKTGLPAEEDHGYGFYLDSFRRVVAKHAEHAGLYRSNHPDCKLVFFVFDESTGYLEIPEGAEMPRHEPGNVVAGHPHFVFFDGSFVEAIRDSNADYFIWYAPFKYYRILADGFAMPDTAVYDVRRIPSETLAYDAHRMFSTES